MAKGNDGDEPREQFVLAEGNMGLLYHLSEEGHSWVRKRIRPVYTMETRFKQRFAAEITAHQRCSPHPAIPQFLGEGEDSGYHYFEMQYLPESIVLQQVRDERSFSPSDKLGYLATISDALQHCHTLGVLHRDVSLRNMLVSQGRSYLIDFGLAYFLSAEERQQFPHVDWNEGIGTPGYTAPEVVCSQEPDMRSDIFSLGAAMYRLFTKIPAFSGKWAAEIDSNILSENPRDPCSLNPHIPAHLQNIILRCLEKDPALRYQAAGEVQRELEKVRKDEYL